MFKRKKKSAAGAAPVQAAQPPMTEAERVINRGKLVESYAKEAAMWRGFAEGCADGRYVQEYGMPLHFYGGQRETPLSARMDKDSAILWREFANRMADERERRLREILG